MGYDLVVLPKNWFFEDVYPGKFDRLANIINTGYDRAKNKYRIIETSRIKKPQDLPIDLQYSPEKDVFLTLLLGLTECFQSIEPREFSKVPFLLLQYGNHFGELTKDNVNIHLVDTKFVIDEDIQSRVLSTVGFKTHNGSKEESTVEYEITAFTSFVSGIGSKLLEFVIENTFKDPNTRYFDSSKVATVHLHAVVIRDHDLVPYYAKYCNFHRFGQPDLLIKANNENSPLEDGIVASRDFHLAFLRRTLQLK